MDKLSNEGERFIIGVVFFFIGVLAGSVCVFNATQSCWRREAVSSGRAEYYLDENHERQWRWNKKGN